MQSIATGPYLLRLVEEDASSLALDTAVPASGYAVKGFDFANHRQCLIVREDRIDYWTADKIQQLDKRLIIHGPWQELESLSRIAERKGHELLALLPRLKRAWEICQDQPVFQGPIFGGSTFIDPDGSIFILPKIWAMQILHHQNQDSERILTQHLTPETTRTEYSIRLRYALGALAYKAISGEFPIKLETLGERDWNLYSRMKRAGIVEPLELKVPGTAPQLSREIQRHLLTPEDGNLDKLMELLQAHLEKADRKDVPVPQDEQEVPAGGSKLKKTWERRHKFFMMKESMRRRRPVIIAGSIAAILVVGALSSLITRLLTPPYAQGWSPVQVVERFYSSINELDVDSMEKLIRNDAAKNMRNMVVQMYVVSKTREAYEFINPIVNPIDWKEAGEPPLQDATFLFGITDLEVESNRVLVQDENEPPRRIITVSYELYLPNNEPLPGGVVRSGFDIEPVREEVHMEFRRETWFISEIKALDQNL